MAMNEDARKTKRSLGFRFAHYLYNVAYLVILLTALVTNGVDEILKADEDIGGSEQTQSEMRFKEILQFFPNWDSRKSEHPDTFRPHITDWEFTEFELRLLGPRTEQAEIAFVIYVMMDRGVGEPDVRLVSEYRDMIHSYYDRYPNPLSSADEEEVRKVREAILMMKGFKSVENGWVASMGNNLEYKLRLMRYRNFLDKCPDSVDEWKRVKRNSSLISISIALACSLFALFIIKDLFIRRKLGKRD